MQSDLNKRPALVWIISIFFLVSAGYTLYAFILLISGAVYLNPQQEMYLASLSYFDYITTIGIGVLNLGGAVALFLLRKQAPYFFLGGFILGLASTVYHAVEKGWMVAIGGPGLVGSFLFQVVMITIVIYAFRLRKRGILK